MKASKEGSYPDLVRSMTDEEVVAEIRRNKKWMILAILLVLVPLIILGVAIYREYPLMFLVSLVLTIVCSIPAISIVVNRPTNPKWFAAQKTA